MVRPIFYKVDPADIRYQKGSYGEALAKHERRFPDNLEKVRWRRALTRSANLSGRRYKEHEYEFTFMDNIVEEISLQLLNETYLDVAEYPIGIDYRVQDIDQLLSVRGNSHCIIGIWGSPGIGKTRIAKAVYNSIAHRFEGRCFLENVGEKSESPEGLVQLLETLLVEILGGPDWKLTSVDKGINVIKQRLRNKRVLKVLDDANKLDWLSKLAGATGLFVSVVPQGCVSYFNRKFYQGTQKIEGIMVKFPKPVEIPLNAKSFSGMRNLKYFINCNACLPNSLKLIDWGRPFHADGWNYSVHIQFRYFNWHLTKVTSLNFDNCKFLKKVPNLSGIPNIKSLHLGQCTSVVEVDPSVGFLEKLVTLDLNRCSNLTKFPTRVCWKSLEDFILLDCKRLKKFPEIVDKMEALDVMQLSGTGIKELPSSIPYLTEVSYIGLDRCQKFTSLPSSIYELQNLDHLGLNHCPKLLTLPSKMTSEVSSSAQSLPLALTYTEYKDTQIVYKMDLSNCHRLLDYLSLDVSKVANVLLNEVEYSLFEVLLPGNRVPKWFNYQKDVGVVVDEDQRHPI
ncbi:hypothetical protein ACLB2K_016778 [Fragaria x ananassa]